jgi:hypothetical protein
MKATRLVLEGNVEMVAVQSLKHSRLGRSHRALAVLLSLPLVLAPSAVALADDKEVPMLAQNADPQSVDNIDPAILATMKQQEALQPAVDALYKEHLSAPNSGFAGIAYEGSGLTLYYKGTLSAEMASAVARHGTGGTIAVRPAAHSLAELESDARKVSDAIKAHRSSDIQAVHLANDGSGLVVERVPASVAAEMAAKRARKGKAPVIPAAQIVSDAQLTVPVRITTADTTVELMSDDVTVNAVASRRNDYSPWNGGGRWEAWRLGVSRGTCTTGFGVKNAAGRKFVLSAGHCATPPDYGRQGYLSSLEFMGTIWSERVEYDILLIDDDGSSLIFDGSNTTSNTKVVHSWGYWVANQLVCQSGQTSGTICGLKQLNSTNIIMGCCDSDGDSGYTIYGVIRTSQIDGATAARPGDSGASVFTLDGTGVRAKGIVSAASGSTMYFQDLADVERQYGMYVVTTG